MSISFNLEWGRGGGGGVKAPLEGSLPARLLLLQSTPDNSNLRGKSKKGRVIGSSKKIAGSKEKNSFYSTVNILIAFNCRNVK